MSKYMNAKANLEATEKRLDEEGEKIAPGFSNRPGDKEGGRRLIEELLRLQAAAEEVRETEESIRREARLTAFADCVISADGADFVTVKAIEALRDAAASL